MTANDRLLRFLVAYYAKQCHNYDMATGLKQTIENYILKHGRVGKARLCDTVGKSERTLARWMDHGIPDAHNAYKLALACGCSETEALRLAREEALPAEAVS